MHEALGMAQLIRGLLIDRKVQDGGAAFRIVITDKAGNVAEVWNECQTILGDMVKEGWTWDEGCNEPKLKERLGWRSQAEWQGLERRDPSPENQAKRLIHGVLKALQDASKGLKLSTDDLPQLPVIGEQDSETS